MWPTLLPGKKEEKNITESVYRLRQMPGEIAVRRTIHLMDRTKASTVQRHLVLYVVLMKA